jgi:hypothetical protein
MRYAERRLVSSVSGELSGDRPPYHCRRDVESEEGGQELGQACADVCHLLDDTRDSETVRCGLLTTARPRPRGSAWIRRTYIARRARGSNGRSCRWSRGAAILADTLKPLLKHSCSQRLDQTERFNSLYEPSGRWNM